MNDRTLLIASGAYVEPELQAEFGRLPPAFLPLGNRRLFVHQHAALGGLARNVLLSVPEDFTPDPTDAALLDSLGIRLVPVPNDLSLGHSLVYCINVTRSVGAPLTILHGDTLLLGGDWAADDIVAAEADAPAEYAYAFVRNAAGGIRLLDQAAEPEPGDLALSGLFSLADAGLFVQTVTRAGGRFLKGLADYAEARPLRAVAAGEWLDFGHSGTYHRSRRRMTTEREFNRLTPTRRAILKSSDKAAKIEGEAAWFEGLPAPLRLFTPAYLGRGEAGQGYRLQYLHLPTLSDLFVFGRLGRAAWGRILDGCDEFLSACRVIPGPAGDSAQLFLPKTLARLEEFAATAGLDLDAPCRLNGAWLPSLNRIVRMAAAAIPDAPVASLVHGDFCFSNILYDTRADMVKVIDPRGIDGAGRPTPFGDLRYDLGKLCHSILGRYDHIIAGYYRCEARAPLEFELDLPDGPPLRAVEEAFATRSFAGIAPDQAAAPAIATLLFLSMLPLHGEDPARQMALLANGLRLFLLLDRGGRPA